MISLKEAIGMIGFAVVFGVLIGAGIIVAGKLTGDRVTMVEEVTR